MRFRMPGSMAARVAAGILLELAWFFAEADPVAGVFEGRASASEQPAVTAAKQFPPAPAPHEVDVQALMDHLAVAPKDQARLLAEIRRLGGRFELDEEAPTKPAVTLIFADNAVEDADLDCLKSLSNLHGLSLRGFLVTDAALAHAAGLTRLQRLDLNFTGVTSAGLKRLADMKELRTLDLNGSFLIDDAGLARVKGLAGLRQLGLTFTRVTDAGVEDLQKARPDLQIRRRYAHRPTRAGGTDSARPRPSMRPQDPPDNRDEQRGSRPHCLLGFSVAKGVYDHPDERWTAIVKKTHARQIGQLLDLERTLAARPGDSRAWRLESWNLSYNLPCELRYSRDRYYWVKQGINVLIEAAKNNPRNPTFVSDVGWIVSQKIGRSDDAREFRKWFADDAEFQEVLIAGLARDDVLGPTGKPDNWLVAKQWFRKAADLAGKEGVAVEHKKPLLYLSDAPLCQMYYAITLEEEGRFDQPVQQAWAVAARDWDQYGWCAISATDDFLPELDKGLPAFMQLRRELPVIDDSRLGQPITIRLNDLDQGKDFQGQAGQLLKQLETLAPGLREKVRKEKEGALTDEQRKALNTPASYRTDLQHQAARQARRFLHVTEEEMVRGANDPEKHAAIRQLYPRLVNAEQMAAIIHGHRAMVNFDYWRLRAIAEQREEVLAARRAIYRADQDFKVANLQSAKENYERGFAAWRRALDALPALARDETFGLELIDVIRCYRRVLKQRDEPFPKPFILQDVLNLHERDQQAH